MGVHKMLDLGPAWPARRARHRGQCRPSCLLGGEELVCDGLYARRHTRLIAAPTARQDGSRAGQVVPSEANLRLPCRGLWASVVVVCWQMGCGPLKRPECDSGSEVTATATMRPGTMARAWQSWQPVGVPSPTSQPCPRVAGSG